MPIILLQVASWPDCTPSVGLGYMEGATAKEKQEDEQEEDD